MEKQHDENEFWLRIGMVIAGIALGMPIGAIIAFRPCL